MPTNEIRATQVGVASGGLASFRGGFRESRMVVTFENLNFPLRISVEVRVHILLMVIPISVPCVADQGFRPIPPRRVWDAKHF